VRFIKIILFILCCVILTNCSQQGSQLHDTNGNIIEVSDLKGKWVILNFWAGWCESCVKEVPELNQFYRHNQNKNIVLYGVNFERMPIAELKNAMNKLQIAYPIILEDPANTWDLDGIEALPVTFIIDPHGNVVKKILGSNTEKSLQIAINELQKVTPR
jgi:thiol-disulfide isomerase/thioredoxin